MTHELSSICEQFVWKLQVWWTSAAPTATWWRVTEAEMTSRTCGTSHSRSCDCYKVWERRRRSDSTARRVMFLFISTRSCCYSVSPCSVTSSQSSSSAGEQPGHGKQLPVNPNCPRSDVSHAVASPGFGANLRSKITGVGDGGGCGGICPFHFPK